MTKECKQQFTLRITQANSTQLIVILYEMTLQYLADGEQAADDAGLAEAVHRARGCIKELLNSLHREYSPAGELSRLYLFFADLLYVKSAETAQYWKRFAK